MKRTLIALAIGVAPLMGCITAWEEDDHHHYVDRTPPAPPVGVVSTTADHAVLLEWIPNREADLAGYRIYESDEPHGPYVRIAYTSDAEIWIEGLDNGRTVYFSVSAVDVHGNESELNEAIIYDTPRPEGFGLRLYEADGPNQSLSAFDFSREERVHWTSARADVFYDWSGGVPYLVVPDYATDIQDAGFLHFDDVTWAPESGWSPSGVVEAIEGHVYVVWTRDDHYAKVRIVDITSNSILVDWGYQVDGGNPELRQGSGGRRPRLTGGAR